MKDGNLIILNPKEPRLFYTMCFTLPRGMIRLLTYRLHPRIDTYARPSILDIRGRHV
jgi:hypothetical protein